MYIAQVIGRYSCFKPFSSCLHVCVQFCIYCLLCYWQVVIIGNSLSLLQQMQVISLMLFCLCCFD